MYLVTKEVYVPYIKEVMIPENQYISKMDLGISALELYRIYEAKKVSADEQYKDERMAVTRTIGMIDKEVLGN